MAKDGMQDTSFAREESRPSRSGLYTTGSQRRKKSDGIEVCIFCKTNYLSILATVSSIDIDCLSFVFRSSSSVVSLIRHSLSGKAS